MPCAVTLKGALEPQIVDEDFHAAVHVLNMVSAKGQTFMIMDDIEGGHVMLNIPNILTIKELED